VEQNIQVNYTQGTPLVLSHGRRYSRIIEQAESVMLQGAGRKLMGNNWRTTKAVMKSLKVESGDLCFQSLKLLLSGDGVSCTKSRE
jgi:hypothetical protein